MGAFSGVGLVLGLCMFLVSFAPSLLPRRWLEQGVIGGMVAAIGYLIGDLLELTADALGRLLGLNVQVSWTMPGGYVVLTVLGAIVLALGWWWSAREHRKTARLVSMPPQPIWHDIASTAVAMALLIVLILLLKLFEVSSEIQSKFGSVEKLAAKTAEALGHTLVEYPLGRQHASGAGKRRQREPVPRREHLVVELWPRALAARLECDARGLVLLVRAGILVLRIRRHLATGRLQ